MHYLPYIFWWGWSAWFLQSLWLVSPLSTSLCSRGCGYNIMCASAWSCMALKPLPASTCLSPAARCWFLWFNLSLSFPLCQSFRALSHLNAPSPLLCLSQQKNLWQLSFDFNHCWLKSPVWHPTMFSCCRAPNFLHLYSPDTTGKLWNLQNELIHLLRL